MVFYITGLFLLLLYTGLIFYYRQCWLQIKIYSSGSNVRSGSPVIISVIIAARNEEENIGACLQSIVEQTYPHNSIEVIIADDHSSDETVSIARSFKKNNIKIIQVKDFTESANINSYKKLAIEKAIGMATGDLIVTTDADCIVPAKWLETLAGYYMQNDPVFIAAPVVYCDPLPGDPFLKKLFKIFQSLDFLTLQGITGASVDNKFHNMCNGANLAYSRKVFNDVAGFEGIDNVASGDDMLLMQKIQKAYPDKTGFIKSRNVIVETQPANTLKEFMNQRIRWASKADKYSDPKITLVLLLVYIFNGWILIAGVASFFSLTSFYLFFTLLVVKTLAELFFLYPVAKFFGKQKLLWWFAPAQPFHILYTLVAGWLGKFGSYKWKGRKVK